MYIYKKWDIVATAQDVYVCVCVCVCACLQTHIHVRSESRREKNSKKHGQNEYMKHLMMAELQVKQICTFELSAQDNLFGLSQCYYMAGRGM